MGSMRADADGAAASSPQVRYGTGAGRHLLADDVAPSAFERAEGFHECLAGSSVRSLARCARPGPEAVAAHVAATDPPPGVRLGKAADTAFAAIHPEAGRIDATLPDPGCGLDRAAVHKDRLRVVLRCTDSGYGMHPGTHRALSGRGHRGVLGQPR